MKHIILYCLAGLLAATPVFSQSKEELLELKKELNVVRLERDNLQLDVDKLKSDLEGKTSEYNDLKSTYDKTRAAYENLKSATDKSKADNLQKNFDEQKKRLFELEEKCKDLENENRNLKKLQKNLVPKDSVKALQMRIHALSKEKAILSKEYKVELVDSIHALQEMCMDLQKRLEKERRMGMEMKKQLERLKKNEAVLSKHLKIVTDSLNSIRRERPDDMPAGAEDDEGYIAGVIAESEAAVASPYDDTQVAGLYAKVSHLDGAVQDNVMGSRLALLKRQLGNYRQAVGMFHDLKKDVDDVIAKRAGQKHKVVYPMVKSVIKNYEEDGAIADIQNIPYLKQQYEKYTEALEADCTKEYTLELIKN